MDPTTKNPPPPPPPRFSCAPNKQQSIAQCLMRPYYSCSGSYSCSADSGLLFPGVHRQISSTHGSGWSCCLGSGSWNRPHLRRHTRWTTSKSSLDAIRALPNLICECSQSTKHCIQSVTPLAQAFGVAMKQDNGKLQRDLQKSDEVRGSFELRYLKLQQRSCAKIKRNKYSVESTKVNLTITCKQSIYL
jgi:hypothetical protein